MKFYFISVYIRIFVMNSITAPIQAFFAGVFPLIPATGDLDPLEWRPDAYLLSTKPYLAALQRANWVWNDVIKPGNEDPLVRTHNMIHWIIGDNPREGNSLQPSRNAQLLLRQFMIDGSILNPGVMTNTAWLSLLGNGDVLYQHVDADARADQVVRAKAIVATLLETNQHVVTLMDGHGRIIYNILRELQLRGQSIDAYEFDICDLDDDVNAWHARFLPASTIVCAENIFESEELRGLVYLNFCGIGDYVASAAKMMKSMVDSNRHIFISFSTRGVSPYGDTPISAFIVNTNQMILGPVSGISAALVSQHRIFYTVHYFPSGGGAVLGGAVADGAMAAVADGAMAGGAMAAVAGGAVAGGGPMAEE